MAPVKSAAGKEATAQHRQEGQQGCLRRRREDGMCQTAEAKQEPSFVSNTFSKQVRGWWAGTQLKGISLCISSNPKDFHLYLPKCHLESSVSAKAGRSRVRVLGSGTLAPLQHPAETPQTPGRCGWILGAASLHLNHTHP